MVFERNRVPPIPIIVNSVDRQNPLSFSKNFQGISDTLLERETLIPSSRFRIPARGLSGTGERVRERERGKTGWMEKEGRGARVCDSNNWSPALQLLQSTRALVTEARVSSSLVGMR